MTHNPLIRKPSPWLLGALILLAGLSRLVPHPMNFTPVEAMALFGGAYFAQRGLAVLVPLLAVLLSDLVMGLVSGGLYAEYLLSANFFAVYGAIALSAVLGFALRGRVGLLSVAGASVAGSLLFFLITNFAVWATATDIAAYPACTTGLVECYAAGLPFFRSTLLGTVVWSILLFGGFELLRSRLPELRTHSA